MKYKVLIWGAGHAYNRTTSFLRAFEEKGQIEIVGITSDDEYANLIDGIHFFHKMDIAQIESLFDVIVVMAAEDNYAAVYSAITTIQEIRKKTIIFNEALHIPGFTFSKYVELYESNLSIMAENCWGGMTYHYLHLPFRSPLINLNLSNADYFKLMRRPEYYFTKKLELVDQGWNWQEGYHFPICRLGDLRLNFVHYHSFEMAQQKFEERKKRINYNNLFLMTYAECIEDAEEFEKLRQNKKFALYHLKLIYLRVYQ